MMNLQEFISETLRQIIDGVSAAQKHAEEKGAFINEPVREYGGGRRIDPDFLPKEQVIDFDIAVTTSSSSEIKGGLGVFVASLGTGYQAEKGGSESAISRVKFSIPIILPSNNKPKDNFFHHNDVIDDNLPVKSKWS